jgi:hypothetical protein
VHDRVERVAREARCIFDVVPEYRRVRRALQEVVQPFRAVAHPEHRAELAEAPRRQPVARREPQVVLGKAGVNREHAVEIFRIPRVEAPVALAHALVSRAIDIVRRSRDRRDPARDECLTQRLRSDRQVSAHAEAAEALPEDAPALDAELLRISSASRTIASARCSRRYAACCSGALPGSEPTGVERPVPRWSSSRTR